MNHAISTNYLFFGLFQPAAFPLGFREPTDALNTASLIYSFLDILDFLSEYIYDLSYSPSFSLVFYLHICHAPSLYKTMSLGIDCAPALGGMLCSKLFRLNSLGFRVRV